MRVKIFEVISEPSVLQLLAIPVVLLVVVLISYFSEGVDLNKASSILRSQGFSDVKFGSSASWACDPTDYASVSFTANARDGAPLEGVVCQNLRRGLNIRWM